MKNLTVMYDFGTVSECLLLDFMKNYGLTLPKKYIELIQKHNGVQFVENCFDYIDSNGDIGESSIGFCAYGNEIGADNIYKFQDNDGLGYDKVIVFGVNGRGDYIAFDYRQNPTTDDSLVVIMYHDDFIEENGKSKMRVVKVADTFDEFLKLLHD
ncbi:SMI1/KNR4 family protein [Acinetobacter guillouiae]|uniref:SMI1/KNR4 family protein n=1 Tax=Acinetobacter guillouiae TaxID=106649 RepID=UPI001D18D4EB|nr:SMI1/KNR4 family protein [Acinetobacter guillouiae]